MNSRNRMGPARRTMREFLLVLLLISLVISLFFFRVEASEAASSNIVAVWANNGEDKVTRDERRASLGEDVRNSVWDGSGIQVFGGRNEVISFNLILEAGADPATNVSVSLNRLTGPAGARISTRAVTRNGVFDWVGRNIELFYVRYLPIRGLSKFLYEGYYYDERHVPERLRRPWKGEGVGRGTWLDRPDHDKYYPDIAVPLELVRKFEVPAEQNQSIWADIYIPKTAPAGVYHGTISIREDGVVTHQVATQLQVRDFSLPDTPHAKTMLYFGYEDVNRRYTGVKYPKPGTPRDAVSRLVRDRHFLMAHRHRISLIDSNEGSNAWNKNRPRPDWVPRLNGSLFTAANQYDGPGVSVGNKVFSIGTYGTWAWQDQGKAAMWLHSDAWVQWFQANSPGTEYFLFLADEPKDLQQVETWSQWIDANPSVGRELKAFSTAPLPKVRRDAPSLDIAASGAGLGITSVWERSLKAWKQTPGKRFYVYNGQRPLTGSFATEDDGVALRVLAWTQYKKGIDRWFYWESTYYRNYQNDDVENNVFQDAKTFGFDERYDRIAGRTGYNYANGDGVLFYPGTDKVYPEDSYNIQGPIASIRLKHWRRGIQDADYLAMANAVNPDEVRAIVDAAVPKVLWEYGVDDPKEPKYIHTDVSWSTDPDVWEARRMKLAEIIENGP